jgi:hypothetical protein
MLNPEFAQPGWQPDAIATYACSQYTTASGFTYLMTLVLSGRNEKGQLARQEEFDALLASPEKSHIACRQVNSEGWTVLMLAVRNSGTDSTEETVARLLAHESSGEVARMQENDGWTALMMSARYVDIGSTSATLTQLLIHESSGEVARMREKNGFTALIIALTDTDIQRAVEQLLAHESARDVLTFLCDEGRSVLDYANRYKVSHATIVHLVKMTCELGSSKEVAALFLKFPTQAAAHYLHLRQRMSERDTVAEAFKAGLSLPTSTVLTYI